MSKQLYTYRLYTKSLQERLAVMDLPSTPFLKNVYPNANSLQRSNLMRRNQKRVRAQTNNHDYYPIYSECHTQPS